MSGPVATLTSAAAVEQGCADTLGLLGGLAAAAGAGAEDAAVLAALRATTLLGRAVERVAVAATAELSRRGVFAERGYSRPVSAVADVLGVDHREATRIVTAADAVTTRSDLQGQVLPPVLPATAAAFASGTAGIAHVQAIADVLGSPVARRLDPATLAGVEEQLAAKTGDYTPTELRTWGGQLVEILDQDGPHPDDQPERRPIDEVHLVRNRNGAGGRLKGRFESAEAYDAIAALLDAKAAPLTADDDRSLGQRQADALVEICTYVSTHGDHAAAPSSGGRRPHLNVLVRLEDLERRARAAMLDHGGTLTPEALRMLCCDAAVIPIVLGGAGQPLDIGRASRSIPEPIRRAVTARDRGCARPGCNRPPAWCDGHHIRHWEHDGPTQVDNVVLLCRAHHREIHSTEWTVRIAPDGMPEFFPPRWLDPDQRARRKPPPHPDRT